VRRGRRRRSVARPKRRDSSRANDEKVRNRVAAARTVFSSFEQLLIRGRPHRGRP
jgi:hypothetical protein